MWTNQRVDDCRLHVRAMCVHPRLQRRMELTLSGDDKVMIQTEPAMFAQLGVGSSSDVQCPAVEVANTRD